MKIGVVGSEGVVGSAVSLGLERLGHQILRYDVRLPNSSIEGLLSSSVVFICVPTPSLPDGSCDSSIVEEVCGRLVQLSYGGIIAIKSSVEPGTTKRLQESHIEDHPQCRIAFVPEFLRERSAFYDFTEGCDVLIIGTEDAETFRVLKDIHGHYPHHVVQITPTEAELAKYFNNLFGALRVVFANDFYEVCKKLGANYTNVKNAVVLRDNMTDAYLDCNENLRAYAGSCYLKNVPAFRQLVKKLGLPCKLFDVINDDNELYRKTVFPGMRAE